MSVILGLLSETYYVLSNRGSILGVYLNKSRLRMRVKRLKERKKSLVFHFQQSIKFNQKSKTVNRFRI